MKVTKHETLYHKDHGATLKHKCGKMIVALSLLPFSLIHFLIWAFSLFFWPLFFPFFIFRPESHPNLWGNHSLHHPFLTWDNALMMIITLLFTYNSKITTRYLEQNMTLCECLQRCTGICNESRVTCLKNYEWWVCHKYDVNYMIMQSNMIMNVQVMYMRMMEVAWKYISEWLWKCHDR